MDKPLVTVVKIHNDDVQEAMDRLFRAVDIRPGAHRIGIKINMAEYRTRETGVCTDPLVLGPLLRTLRSRFPTEEIFLFEHDSTGVLADNIYRFLGLDRIAEKYDVPFVNLRDAVWVPLEIPGHRFRSLEVPELLLRTDLVINHPKLKTHGRTLLTCGLKNMFGCWRIKNKNTYHAFLDEAIADINLAIRSTLIIVDGYIALEGNRGPTQGFPRKMNMLIGGNDVVAVDSFAARLMGFGPCSVRHITLAAEKSVGSMQYQLDSELSISELRASRFQFSMVNHRIMEIVRRFIRT